ncbi:SusC/RagA family TonB-linked outer membrane protein [Arenibacter sp. S6351L]|uniref:SusC/RagA family TonB-linked outer membrane protein n=1 Tax=Arenibacter sp. S6351L TaxID=2926407 RepID=UPI001FF12C67|nr:SusC/RagA family TonB-linked outer membrane protein [Arenibacter sp. S6351L]MCK0134330.1 SusC/RagA family TonB-linked outer membrane protein [Arenibacter sp. S6351L]
MKLKLLKSFLLFGTFLCFGLASAQEVSGTVSDATGPLPGASVVVKGTTNGAQTDFDGNFIISDVDASSTLVFSYIGYKTQEVVVGNQTTLNIMMEEDAQALAEVVIIGYGTTTVKDATGAVSAVTSEDFNGGVISSPEQLIQGKTAGVQISQGSGEPGSGVAIRIRGTSSVRSNNDPLFVVDGVPLPSGGSSSEGTDIGVGSSSARNPLSFLNPNDIESMSILKDASSTAIYGSRGANGVVIITTKSGKGGAQGGTWEFSSDLSFSSPANDFDLLNRSEFLSAVSAFGGTATDLGNDTDWQSLVTRNSSSTNNNLAYSQNYGSGNVRATFNYGKQFGIVPKSSQERVTGRINLSQRLFEDKLRLDLQTTLSRVNDEAPPLSGSAGSTGDMLGAAYSANPTWPANSTFNPGDRINPLNLLENWQSLTFTDRFLVNFSASYDIVEDLTAKATVGYDKSNSTREAELGSKSFNVGRGAGGNGRGTLNDLNLENRLLELTLSYKKEFDNSVLDVLGGFSYQDFNTEGRNVEGWGYSTTNLNSMARNLTDAASKIESMITGSYQQYGYATGGDADLFVNRLFPTPETDKLGEVSIPVKSIFTNTFDNTDELQSFFARANYSIASKYLFTATVRADGSSRFGENNRYGIFPSAAFAWKINEENFMGDAMSTLKLRLSYGITGNQDGLGYGRFARRERYSTTINGDPNISDGGDVNVPGITTVEFANPDLKWEETTQYNVGLDFGFANDRFSGSVDVYRKETRDLLLNIEAAQPSPQPTFFQNLDAVVLNQGAEFSLNYDILQGDDFDWTAGFNVAYNKNEITDFDGEIAAGTIRGAGLSNAFAQRLASGQPLYSFYLREFTGFDANGNPVHEGGVDNQQFVGKSALPDFTGGFSTSASYKNWSASMYFNGQFGNYIYNNTANAFFTGGAIGSGNNVTQNVVELAGQEGRFAEASVSTRFLEKGDFVRLQTASISYDVPLKDGLFKSMRLSLTGQNLFVITDYSGLDPEVSVAPASAALLNGLPIAGIDYSAFPRPRTYTLGFNVTF